MEDLGPRLMAADAKARNVAVIGGGWAGMAAGVSLAAAGIPVTVFEAARMLGGRARRVALPDATVDNGQHLLLGAYRATLALIDQMHAPGEMARLFARTPLCLQGPGTFRLCAAPLPAPLHLLAGLLAARGCTMPERLAVMRAFVRWRIARWTCPREQTVASLVQDQPAAMVANLWTPLCLAALNTPPGAASGQVLLNVLRDALAADRPASDLIIPVADLSSLFPDPAARYVEEHGGRIRLGATVRGLDIGDDAIAVQVAGVAQRFRHVVVAAAPWQTARLLRAVPAAADACAQIAAYGYQPITTVYLRYDSSVALPARMLQLDGGPGQWLFERSAAGAGHALLAVVISADGPHCGLAQVDLVRAVASQLHANLPGRLPQAAPTWARVITERRATHAAAPARAHPVAGHIGSGIYLAGDHTDPDYPATLEAAVRSGIRAAASVQECL